ncbi:MAG: DUF2066 domain-containing protein [Pseudomonadota bacterium]
MTKLRALSSALKIIFLGFALGWAGPALAIGDDVFVVPRVTVQAEADSATAAKNAAQNAGRRRAMDILLRRLTVEEDWVYLPRLARGEAAPASAGVDGKNAVVLSPRDLELLESSFEVNNEKSSPKTYRAYITYRFKPAAVRRLLKDARIPYSEAQTRTALVLPVLQTRNGLYLWEENNPWMAAWKVRPYDNELTPMAAPLGDLEDQAAISPRDALSLHGNKLELLAQRYGVSQVIVAHAFLNQVDGEDQLRVRLINGYRESGVLEPIEELGADAGFDGPSQSVAPTPQFGGDDVASSAKVGDVLAEGFFKQASGNFPMLAQSSIESAIAKYASSWKARTLIDHSAASVIETTAFFDSIGEWTKIRAALVDTPLIGSVQVRSLSRRGAEMLIRAYGDPGKLIVAMEAQGLALWSDDGETWMIATPATAQTVRRTFRRRGGRNRYSEGEPTYNDEAIVPASEFERADGAETKIESRY